MGDTKIQQDPGQNAGEMKGWLFKWTNYLKGYQRRWFVLSKGLLSYYRHAPSGGKSKGRHKRKAGKASQNQAEMSHTCRGTISLHGALIHTVDPLTFVVSNGGTHTFHIKAGTENERQQWVIALELAKAKAIQAMESEEEDFHDVDNKKGDDICRIKDLNEKLETLQKWNEVLTKRGTMLQRALNDLEQEEMVSHDKIKAINEKATQFRVAANAMTKSSEEYLQLAQQQEPKWKKMLQHEREQKNRIEKMVEQLARQHSHLEEAAQQALPDRNSNPLTSTSPSEDDEFYDAQESDSYILSLALNPDNNISRVRLRQDSQGSDDGSSSENEQISNIDQQTKNGSYTMKDTSNNALSRLNYDELVKLTKQYNDEDNGEGGMKSGKRKRRTRVPDKPNYPLNLWSIMKNCIGKELSKIPMPVNFSEPLSMLQRLTEDFEYADLLDKAANCTDYFEQMAYVAAFTVSSYSTTANRTGKPFNPLLGETYECDRTDDLGWKIISEQVSHHPPIAAQHCEGSKWQSWQEFTMASKFRGKHLQVIPLGTAHLEFKDGNSYYTWRKVTTTVHNIIVGKLWVDQSGEMEIINHKQGISCHLKYIPYSYFSRDSQRKVKGEVMNSDKEVKYIVQGMWDTKMEIAPVLSTSGSSDNPVYKTGSFTTAWTRQLPPEDSEKYYNFTILACQLNEPEEGVAPTDSRRRPDQRLMEEGFWDEANGEKVRLEEKQRSIRKLREQEAEKAALEGRSLEPYEPVWFKKEKDPYLDSTCYLYKGEYWSCKEKQDWSKCPNIF